MFAALLVITLSILGNNEMAPPSGDPGPDASDWFEVPSGPLPWALPVFPDVEEDLGIEVPDGTFDSIEHSAEYTEAVDNYTDNLEYYSDIIEDASGVASSWLNGEEMPDMTEGDFDTGLNPLGSGSMHASDFTEEFGANIGTAFQFVRLLGVYDLGGATYAFGFMLMCVVWMIFMTIVKFAVQIADMITSVAISLADIVVQVIDKIIPLL